MMIHRKKHPLFIVTAMLMVCVFVLIGANNLFAESSRSAGEATLTLTKAGDTVTFGLETDTVPVSAFSFDIVHNGTISGTVSPCQSSIDPLNCNPMYDDETIRVNYYSAQTALFNSIPLFEIAVEDSTTQPYCVNVDNLVFVTADLEPITITNSGNLCELIPVTLTPTPTDIPPTLTPTPTSMLTSTPTETVLTGEVTATPEIPLSVSLKSSRSVTSIALLAFIVMMLIVLMGVTCRFRSHVTLLLLLCGVMMLSMSSASPTMAQTNASMGDVNCDGSVDVIDALLSDQYANGLRDGDSVCAAGGTTDVHTAACDVNLDGSCTVEDADIIAHCDAGYTDDAFCNRVTPDSYIITPTGIDFQAVGAFLGGLDGEHINVYDDAGAYVVIGLSPDSLPDLQANTTISYGFDAYIEAYDVASWGLDRIDQRQLPLDDMYNPDDTGANVHVYVMDTGIRSTHNEFTGRMGDGFTVINDGRGWEDCHGHGTHVAGTAGGTMYGVAKNVTLHSIRVLDCNGRGTWSGVIQAVDWLNANHQSPAIVNMSLGGGKNNGADQAIKKSINRGISYVVAAGNNYGRSACNYSPAGIREAITVGASTESDTVAFFSNLETCIDLFAPGNSIVSAYHTSDTAVRTLNGTSMASPHVAGAAALLLEQNPSATPAEIETTIVNMATDGVLSGVGTAPNKLLYVEPDTSSCLNITQIPQQECEALIALYESTDGDNWTDNTDWLETNTPCSWKGITCWAGYVTHVNLPLNNLNGAIPLEIGQLSNLSVLHLHNNEISGTIPAILGDLSNLQSLMLQGTSLIGDIPSELGQLSNLKTLNISLTDISGEIPSELGQLSSLEILNLEGNQLEGGIPSELGQLSNLIQLQLDGNNLTGNIPSSISGLPLLEVLQVQGNDLSGCLPSELTQLSNLNSFLFHVTELKEQPDDVFQAWLQAIDHMSSTGLLCE